MPRAVLKVQGAPNKTRWTLAQNSPTLWSEKDEKANMQANGFHFHDEPPLPHHVSYDESIYSSSPPDQTDVAGWRPSPGTANDSPYDDYTYNTPRDEQASHGISLNTRVPSQSQTQDAIGQHLLYETALLDSQAFESLDIAEVDALKKEQARLNARIEAASRRLAFENKVKDAAQNLQRLYTVNKQNRADTPQSPNSPRKSRSSLLGNKRRTSSGSGTINVQAVQQADSELATSMKKVEELDGTIKGLLDRRQYVDGKLLRHTAAVLAEETAQRNRISDRALSGGGRANGNTQSPGADDGDDDGMYAPNEFDGIRDILYGMPAGSNDKLRDAGNVRKLQQEHEQHMASVQNRLEQLNNHMRHVLDQVSRTRGRSLRPEPEFNDASEDAIVRLDKRFGRIEEHLRALEDEQEDVQQHYKHVQDSAFMTRNAVEEQLERLNQSMHNTLLLSADMQAMQSLREPPSVTGHGYQHQVQYLEDSLMSMGQLLRQHNEELQNAREASEGASKAVEEAQTKAASHARKAGEYETVLGSLWEILQSNPGIARRPSALSQDSDVDSPLRPPQPSLKEDFSLQAFNTRVRHLFDGAQSAKEQHDILKRQIQQQRELNGKSDAKKDRELTDLQGKHDQLAADHGVVQEELTKVMTQHSLAQTEASKSRSELMNVANELDTFKQTVDNKQHEHDELARQLQTHQSRMAALQKQIAQLQSQVSELHDGARISHAEAEAKLQEAALKHQETTKHLQSARSAREAAEQRHATVQDDRTNLESEVVRLTTELTMAKAELDSAYGSRAERAQKAQAVESANSERVQQLEKELQEMTDEFQELTRESLELEHERSQLEELIDGLRDRCDALEYQLSDEKVRWLGMRSPGVAGAEKEAREMTSMMVLRQEFKKMMRETRAEGVRLLRAEQEQRRELEAELRRLRQTPPAKANGMGSSHNHIATPA